MSQQTRRTVRVAVAAGVAALGVAGAGYAVSASQNPSRPVTAVNPNAGNPPALRVARSSVTVTTDCLPQEGYTVRVALTLRSGGGYTRDVTVTRRADAPVRVAVRQNVATTPDGDLRSGAAQRAEIPGRDERQITVEAGQGPSVTVRDSGRSDEIAAAFQGARKYGKVWTSCLDLADPGRPVDDYELNGDWGTAIWTPSGIMSGWAYQYVGRSSSSPEPSIVRSADSVRLEGACHAEVTEGLHSTEKLELRRDGSWSREVTLVNDTDGERWMYSGVEVLPDAATGSDRRLMVSEVKDEPVPAHGSRTLSFQGDDAALSAGFEALRAEGQLAIGCRQRAENSTTSPYTGMQQREVGEVVWNAMGGFSSANPRRDFTRLDRLRVWSW